MPPHQIPTDHHPFKNPNPQIALQLRFIIHAPPIRPPDSALRQQRVSSSQVHSLLVRPPHVHRLGVHFRHHLHHHSETPRRSPGTAVRQALPLHFAARLLGKPLEHHGQPCPATYRIRSPRHSRQPSHWQKVGPTPGHCRYFRRVRSHARAGLLLHQARDAHVGGLGALVGRHVLLSRSWTVRGCGGCTEKGPQREEVAVPEGGVVAVVAAVVAVCALHSHSAVSTRAGAVSCLRESNQRVDQVCEGCVQCF
ncbi:uncharacterized protein HKW66_Vig0069760 [Vigna angularis]|uniref:Uncharacterized protein n=1 Tax=Phaseolus angularis TaxID=3914 RepID=A0A8T0K860_PHAAN|nr:uncharacterized protein HKW66_Vig0069760 [Vigna angularis]